MEYLQSRPGLKVLQQKIDDSITAHKAQLEQVLSSSVTLSVILNLILNYSILLIILSYNCCTYALKNSFLLAPQIREKLCVHIQEYTCEQSTVVIVV
jgi:hypothetical protein